MKGVAERIAGIDRSVETGLPKLDGAHKRHRACWGSISECEVCMLITLSDERAQIATCKPVLGDDLRPVSVIANIRRKAGGLVRAHIHSQRVCHRRAHTAPFEDVAIGRMLKNLQGKYRRSSRRPRHYLSDQISVGRLPDERWPARKAERLALLAADSSIHADGREDVQGFGGISRGGQACGRQHGVE